MEEKCIFCAIVAGKAPAQKLGQTEDLVIIPDIAPQAPVHLLFISKSHGEELANVAADKLMRMLQSVRQEISRRELSKTSYRIAINGAGASMVKNHLHIHLLGKEGGMMTSADSSTQKAGPVR